MISYDNIRIKSPYNIKIIEDIKVEYKVNEHAHLYLKGIVEDSMNFNTSINASSEDEVHIYALDGEQEKTIFKGITADIKTINRNGVYYIELEVISKSFQLDAKKKSCSFQDTSMKYTALINEVIKSNKGFSFRNSIGEEDIGTPIIQYKETDWEFIKRVASKFNSVIVCDIMEKSPIIYLGMPEGKSYNIGDDIPYTAKKDLLAFKKAGGYEAGFHDTDFFYYEIITEEQYAIGDEICFRKKKMYVTEISAYMERGILKYKYTLTRPKGIYQKEIHNTNLKGASLEGKVLEVKGELVKLHLNIDVEQSRGKAYWFPFAPPTGNTMYCMPKIGSYASLYFPEASENNAAVLGCIRKNGDSCLKTGNPNMRYFGTEYGSELELTPSSINIVAGSKEPLKICFDDALGVTLTSHKKLTLNAGQEISFITPKRINISAQSQLFMKKSRAASGFSIENEYHFKGNNTGINGADRASYSKYNDDPQVGTPTPAPAPKEEKNKGFNWGNILKCLVGAVSRAAMASVASAAAFTGLALSGGSMLLAGAAVGATAAIGLSPSKGGEKGNNKSLENYIKESVNRVLVGALLGTIGTHSRGKSTTVLSWIGDKIKDIFDSGTSKINKPSSKLADDSNLLDVPIIPKKEAIKYINGGMLGAYCEQEASKMPQVIAFKDGEYTEVYALKELKVKIPFMAEVEQPDIGKFSTGKLYTYQKIYSNEPQLNIGIITTPDLVTGLKGSKWVNKNINLKDAKKITTNIRKGDKVFKAVDDAVIKSDNITIAERAAEAAGILKSTPELEAHIIYRDTSVPIKRGIGGAHNEVEFLKNEVKIINTTPSTTVPGVRTVEYNMPKLDGSTYPAKPIPGEYGSTTFTKTIYNPNIISDSKFMSRGLEAANSAALPDGTLPAVWEGIDSLGVKWTGYFRNGKIDSFFPSN